MLAGDDLISPKTTLPKLLCLFQRINIPLCPPLLFVTKIVKSAVMNGA